MKIRARSKKGESNKIESENKSKKTHLLGQTLRPMASDIHANTKPKTVIGKDTVIRDSTIESSGPVKKTKPETVIYTIDTAVRLINRLSEMSKHGGVLQWDKSGFYVQIQVEVPLSSETANIQLQWQPITGVHTNPLTALKEASRAAIPGRLQPPPNINSLPSNVSGEVGIPTKMGLESSKAMETPTGALETQKQAVTKTPKLKVQPIGFIALNRHKDPVIRAKGAVDVRVVGVQPNHIFTVSSDKTIGGVVFSKVTGKSRDDNFEIIPSMLGEILNAVEGYDDENVEVASPYEMDVRYIELPEPPPENEAELDERLSKMVGKKVQAERKFQIPNAQSIVEGVLMGKNYRTANSDQLHWAIESTVGKKNRMVAVKSGTIKVVE